jgi:hypothetical protein
MARSNPNCDFLVLNIDPNFTTNLSPEVTEKKENVDLKLLKGHLNPAKNPQFYSEIGNNLHRFNKVVFCSHTCPAGALDFHPLHRHCEEKKIDCITIGAYFNQSPCCIIRQTLIQENYVHEKFFDTLHWYIDDELIRGDSNQFPKLLFVLDFFQKQFGLNENDQDKKNYVETKKRNPEADSIELFTGIEDPDFIRAVGNFVDLEKKQSNSTQSKSTVEYKSTAESIIIGAGVGVITGLACVSALGLGIVSAPALAIVPGTAIVGASAFYLINQENSKR